MFITPIDDHFSIRKIAIQDAQPLFELIQQNSAYLMPYLPWLTPELTLDDEIRFIQDMLTKQMSGLVYATVILEDQKVIGNLDLHQIDVNNRRGAVGYWLDAKHQGQGIMTKAVAKLVAIGFTELNLNRIEIEAVAKNKPSRRVAERLGFQLEGTLRQYVLTDGEFEDMVIYSQLQAEWAKQN